MGVQSLWNLLSPVGRPVLLETMEGKRMAIDSSIWIYQFQATMRDKEGRGLVNAHVLGFLRRITKLLFYGIKPVFVFDGGAPALKRSTLVERKKKKAGAVMSHAKLAEKLLAAQMRREAITEARKNKSKGNNDLEEENTVFLDEHDFSVARSPTKSPSKKKKATSKWTDHDPYRLPDVDVHATVSHATRDTAAPDPRLATEEELRHFIDEMKPEDFDVTSESFRELPTEVQYEIVGDLRLKSRQTSYSRLQNMLRSSKTPLDFSKQQIANLKQRNNLTQQLLTTTDDIGRAHISIPVRIASERNREYVLIKNDGPGGGWVLGIQDDVGTTKDRPIKIDQDPSDEDDDDDDMEMEEVEIPGSAPTMDKDLRDYSRNMALSAIARRQSPTKRSSVKPSTTPLTEVYNGEPSSLHEFETSEGDADPELAIAIQASLEDNAAYFVEDTRLATALSIAGAGPSKSHFFRSGPSVAIPELPPQRQRPTSFQQSAHSAIDSAFDIPSFVSGSSSQDFGMPSFVQKSAHDGLAISSPPAPNLPLFLEEQEEEDITASVSSPDSPSLAEGPSSNPRRPGHSEDADDDLEESLVKSAALVPKQAPPISSPVHADQTEDEDEDMDEVEVPPPPRAGHTSSSSPSQSSTDQANEPVISDPGISSLHQDQSSASTSHHGSQSPVSPSLAPRTTEKLPTSNLERDVGARSLSPIPAELLTPDAGTLENVPDVQAPSRAAAETQQEVEDWDAAQEMDVHAEEGEFVRFLSQVKGKDLEVVQREIDDEIRDLNQQRKAALRDSEDVNTQMVSQIMMMLRLFGIPYITAPMEAEAQCAELVDIGLVDGAITDDSDVFLFGAHRVFKNMFNQSKTVECFLLSDLSRELGLDRDTLVRLAYLLGSDYTEGLPGVGPVVAMELLKEFPGEDGLHKFKDWWVKVQNGKDGGADTDSAFKKRFKKRFKDLYLSAEWPNPAVRDAYYHPTVDSSEEPFKWGLPDLDALRGYLHSELGWRETKVDELLLPIITKMGKRNQPSALNKQGNLNNFFDISAGSGTFVPRQRQAYASKRLQQVISDFRKSKRASSSTEGSPSQTEDEGAANDGEEAPPPTKKRKTRAKGKETAAHPKSTTAKASRTRKKAVRQEEEEEPNSVSADEYEGGEGVVPDKPLSAKLRPKPRAIRRTGKDMQD